MWTVPRWAFVAAFIYELLGVGCSISNFNQLHNAAAAAGSTGISPYPTLYSSTEKATRGVL